MRYELAIFDLDGTLADSFPFFMRVHNELARKHGFSQVAPDQIEAMRALPTRQIMVRSGLRSWRLPLVARDFARRMRAADEVRLFEGVPEALRGLSASALPLALVTSNSRENVDRLLDVELSRLFGHFECGASLFGKRGRLKRAMRALRVAPARSIYVGDTSADGDAARAAGADFGAVEWGYGTSASLAACRPSLQFATVKDLLQIAARRA
ncbi:MAG: HAD hydrolase-like protein [Arenimonas sp.]